jgi:hypothetical protein
LKCYMDDDAVLYSIGLSLGRKLYLDLILLKRPKQLSAVFRKT